MDPDGTVAVVRGLGGAGLTVTLFDSGRQYTLAPGNCNNSTHPISNSTPVACHTKTSQCDNVISRRESSVQATDGRYASTYKMMHCHVSPTSPPDQVTEFPPQRAEICPGYGNFEVGGPGSGERCYHPPRCDTYRKGVYSPDRVNHSNSSPSGSFFSPRASLQQDSFATSLRKYPNLGRDRSSEVVEKLINFAQVKNSSKNTSPTRHKDIDLSKHTFCVDESSSHGTVRGYLPEVHLKPKRTEDSPTRERQRDLSPYEEVEPWQRSTFCKTNDVRYLRDVSRKVRQEIKNLSAQANNQPERLYPRDRDYALNRNERKPATQWSTNSVNMEIQAAVQMISREVVTVPRAVPSQKTIAVPVTPSSSTIKLSMESKHHLDIFQKNDINISIVETHLDFTDMNVQTTINNTVIENQNRDNILSKRLSKSEQKLKHLTHCKTTLDINEASCPKATDRYRKFHKSNKSFRELLKLARRSKKSKQDHTKNLAVANIFKCISISKICYAEVAKEKNMDENILKEVLQNWIDRLPLKITNYYERRIVKEYLLSDLFELSKNVYSYKQFDNGYKLDKLRTGIINTLEVMPLDLRGNQKIVLRNLADSILTAIKHNGFRNKNKYNILQNTYNQYDNIFQRYIAPTESEIRKFISREIRYIADSFKLNLDKDSYKHLEDDIVDVAVLGIEALHYGGENNVKNDLSDIFTVYGLSKKYAYFCANILVRHLKGMFLNDLLPHKVKSETFFPLHKYKSLYHEQKNHEPKLTVLSNKDKIISNIDIYINELCKEIDSWISTLHIQLPEETELRQAVVHDLACDVSDRHKYLNLNLDQEISHERELEHLKYQIFKWMNKHVEESNLKPLEHAMDLMNRIKKIPVPQNIFSPKLNDNINKDQTQYNNIICNTSLVKGNPQSNSEINSTQYPNLSLPEYKRKNNDDLNTSTCCHGNKTISQKTVEQLEAEYEQFVEDWVKRIPIELSSTDETDVAEKARLGINNGLWKVISKFNCDPATYYNRFLYEDLLDDAIDDLLNCLPQTQLLQSRRHVLKVEFIEKTIEINDKIKEIEDASFKTKLMKNLATSLRKQGITKSRDDDPIKLYEDLQIMKIIENYLLSTRFREEDKIKSEVYRRKLLKQVEDFVNSLKKNHAKELRDIDISSYKTDIVNVLQKVPMPNENTLVQEADDVLMGMKIEQWYSDLPVVQNLDYTEQYQRRRQRDILAKKIKELEMTNDTENLENAMKHEVSRFLERTPLKEGESLNINFMIDELVNRLKNRYDTNQSTKNAISHPFDNYENFRKNIPLCSSPISQSTTKDDTYKNLNEISQCDESCGGQTLKKKDDSQLNQNRVSIKEPPSYRLFEEERPITSTYKEPPNLQWHTLEESQALPNRREYMSMQSLPPFVIPVPNDNLDIPDEEIKKPDCCKLNQFFSGNNADTSNPRTSKIKTDRGILGTSQVAGPSGNIPSYSKNNISHPNMPQMRPSSPDKLRYPNNKSYQSQRFRENESYDEPKCSIECQTQEPHHNAQYPYEIDYPLQNKVSRAINTTDFGNYDPNLMSTPHQTNSINIPSVPSKKKTRLSVQDKDSARRRLNFEDSDDEDEDDVPCRCLEKYLKKQYNIKQYPCEDYRCPPYLPVFIPYPYPFL